MTGGAHRLIDYDVRGPFRFVACCECGWRSRVFSSAGLAAAAWDEHVAACDEPTSE